MTYSVHQHWDPLRVCVVGKSYPPEFYSWIKIPRVRSLFEKIAQETEEDYQKIISKLHEFNVKVLRPDISPNFGQYLLPDDSRWLPPPMNPRDISVMIGETFYHQFCSNIEGYQSPWTSVINDIKSAGNSIVTLPGDQGRYINGAVTTRIGKDLYFGSLDGQDNIESIKEIVDSYFYSTRNHIIKTTGHSDGIYCPVCPGLIISLEDISCYSETFPGWEVVYLPNQSWEAIMPFLKLKIKNQGRWWIPGWEHDQELIDIVETWLNNWTGFVEETVFDVNMLVIDPKNVMVFNYNKKVFDALERFGITAHIVPFRHRYFWDGGIHCVTSDLHREGVQQDYFPERQ